MSLLNNMLNDLEKRQAGAGSGQPLSGGIVLPPPTRRRSYVPVVSLAVVAVAAGAGGWAWINHQKPDAQPAQLAATHAPAKTAPANPLPVSEKQPSPAVPAAQAAKPKVTPVRNEAARADIVPPKPDTTEAAKQATAKPLVLAITNEKTVAEPAKVYKQEKPAPRAPASQLSTTQSSQPSASAGQPSSYKIVTPQQHSNNLYQQAISLLQQSRATEAQQTLRQALDIHPANHGARQLLAESLVEAGRRTEATALLRTGLEIAPGDGGFSMMLARLQIADGAKGEALATLEQGQASAANDPKYQAFFAALLQNQGRHAEAVSHYLSALHSNPSMPAWLIGVGISLQAENKLNDAAEAFQRAIDTGELSPEVAQFANQRLTQIRQQR